MQSLKLILVGDSGSGKTSLINSFMNCPSLRNEKPTISPGSYSVEIETDEDHTVNIQIWDTAGQEKYYTLSQMFYREANLALLCYTKDSVSSIEKWIGRVKEVAPACLIILTETKADLMTEEERYEERCKGFDLKSKCNATAHYLTSAYDGTNVFEVFADSAKLCEIVHGKAPVILQAGKERKNECCQ